jgi:ubiquinone/menaquinone biosynthesis C-methylase UbiE
MKPAIPPVTGPKDDRAERQRLAHIYASYAADPYYRKIWSANPASRFMLERKWVAIAKVLRDSSIDLTTARVVDLGAGDGGDCAQFVELGVGRGRLVALDILETRARHASRSHAGLSSIVANCSTLPFPDGAFDVVYQSTMLSSVLDDERRSRILKEVDRVLRRGGVFLSYDVRYKNPWNRHTRPLNAAELRRLLRGWSVRMRTVTLIPQVARLVAPVSTTGCRMLETVGLLRSHLLALARKPG